jgi:hypothetical protein
VPAEKLREGDSTRTLTVALKGAGDEPAAASTLQSSLLPNPPATYYAVGEASDVLSPDGTFTPQAGMRVSVLVDGQECAHTQTRSENGQVVFVVDVPTEWPGGSEGCGAPGREVRFQIESELLKQSVAWRGSGFADIHAERVVYLPLIAR